MNTEELTFVDSNGCYEGEFTSTGGAATVQISQEVPSDVDILAALSGMENVSIGHIVNHHSKNLIFEVCVAESVKITVRSWTKVNAAKIILE